MSLAEIIKSTIREVPDFPKPGINFKDITPLLENPQLSSEIVNAMAEKFKNNVDAIVGVESRGFLFGMMLAQKLNIPFIMVRKQGKLPYKTIQYEYELEYGKAVIEMHFNSIKPGWRVIVHDDLLATGGTAVAASEVVKMQGGKIAGFAFVIELSFLRGADKLHLYSKNIINFASF